MSKKKMPDNEIVLYTAPGGDVNIDVLFEDDNLWLPQRRMAELFGCTDDNISLHLKPFMQNTNWMKPQLPRNSR